MNRLVVLAPQFGVPSETFIRRHIEELAPSRTVAVAAWRNQPSERTWSPTCESHFLSDHDASTVWRMTDRAIASRFGIERWGRPAALRQIVRREAGPTLLIEYLHTALPFLDALASLDARTFIHGHGLDIYGYARDDANPLRRALPSMAGFAEFIVPSEHARTVLEGAGIPGEKVHVCPYGTRLPAKTSIGSREARASVRICAVGRHVAKKSPILLLESFRRAREIDDRLHLDYVGEGPLFPAARDFVRAMNLGERVSLHGALPHEQTLELLAGSSLFIQHSIEDPATGDCEGVPVAIIEALAHGIPVVTTRHSGIPEVVEHGVNGILVPEGSVDAMASAIASLSGDESLRDAMGRAARQIALRRLDWESVVRPRLEGILGLEGAAS